MRLSKLRRVTQLVGRMMSVFRVTLRGVAGGGVGGVATPPVLKTGGVDPPTFGDALS